MAFRPAVRSLWRSPQLTAVAVILLALGVGANAVLFALADAVMLRPFPFVDPDRLVIGGGLQAGHRAEVPYPDFLDWQSRNRSFDDLAAMASSNWTGALQAGEPTPIDYRASSSRQHPAG